MGTRRERVLLELDDQLTPGLARAAVASKVLDRSLNDLGKTSTRASKDVDRVGDSSSSAGSKTTKASSDIDKFSGRLKVLLDVAVLLGPAIVPLGAAAIPLLTGSMAAMGAAAGGIGASVLALKGMGNALGAIDAYNLEPTADNLQALRIEMEKLGPAGAHLARYLESIGGELKTLQIAAREGLLPGLEDGIDLALERLPGVRKIIRELAEGMGELAIGAGGDLAPGGGFQGFFRYLDTDAKDTLVSFGNAIGDIANGLADMLVAFAPVTRSFTGGFEDMAQAFADWAAGLGDSDDFQAFLRYIQVNGPKAIDLLGSIATTFADIAESAAPVGAITLPILTKFLDLIGALASSPLGSPFVAAIVGITAYTRALDLAERSQKRFATAKAGGFASAGPGIAVAAITVGITQIAAANDDLTASIKAANDAIDSGDPEQQAAALEVLRGSIEDTAEAAGEGGGLTGIWKQSTAAGIIFGGGADILGAKLSELTGQTDEAADAVSDLESEMQNGDGLADLLGQSIGKTARQMRVAAGDAEAFSGALAELNGWLDKRQSLRDYNASIRTLSRSMKNGFTRKDVENLDDIGRNIAQVASQIKDKSVRAAFLDQAQAALENLARKGGPKARAEIQKILNKMTELGLFKAEPKIDADKKSFDSKMANARSQVFGFDGLQATATINVTRKYKNELRSGAPSQTPGTVDDLFTPDVSRFGRGSASTFGRGSVTTDTGGKSAHFDEVFRAAGDAAHQLTWSLGFLNQALRKAEKAVAREAAQRDAIASNMESIRGDIRGDLSGSLFSVSEASGNPWEAGATPGGVMDPFAALQERKDRARRMLAAIKTLKKKGVIGAALQEILGEGLEAIEYMAAQPASALGGFVKDYNETSGLINQAANAGANAAFGAQFAQAQASYDQANATLQAIEKAIKQLEKSNKAGHAGTKEETGKGWGRVRAGTRRGKAAR